MSFVKRPAAKYKLLLFIGEKCAKSTDLIVWEVQREWSAGSKNSIKDHALSAVVGMAQSLCNHKMATMVIPLLSPLVLFFFVCQVAVLSILASTGWSRLYRQHKKLGLLYIHLFHRWGSRGQKTGTITACITSLIQCQVDLQSQPKIKRWPNNHSAIKEI
jgi:hypothetical protein